MTARPMPIEDLATHAGWLRRIARALVRDEDDGADVAQTALIAAWREGPPVPGDARPWLAHVARRRAQDHLRAGRRRGRREQMAVEGAEASVSTPEELVGDLEIHRAVATAVAALDQPYRDTVVMRYYDGLSAADIARRLGVPQGTVRWRLKEGLDRVRRRLDERYGERGRWMVALAPVLSLPAVPPQRVPAVPAAGATVAWTGGARLVISALLVAGAIGGGLSAVSAWRRGRAQPSHQASADPRSDGTAAPRAPSIPLLGPRPAPEPDLTEPGAAPVSPDTLVRQLLAALAEGSYDQFVAPAADMFKARLHKHLLHAKSAEVGPSLRAGFALYPLGTLRREDGVLHLWRVELRDGEDLLVRMELTEGKVAAFAIE